MKRIARLVRFPLGCLAWLTLVYTIVSGIVLYTNSTYIQLPGLVSPVSIAVEVHDWFIPRSIHDSVYRPLWLPLIIFYTILLMFWWRFKTWWK
jgi:hypothetical protein